MDLFKKYKISKLNLAKSLSWRCIGTIDTSIEECERRDINGLYKKARAGEIKNLTGIDAPYEPPLNSDTEVETEKMTKEESVKQVIEHIKNKITLKYD